jgi:hypothetical protein
MFSTTQLSRTTFLARFYLVAFLLGISSSTFIASVAADEPEGTAEKAAEPGFPSGDELPNLTRLAKDQDVWYDPMRKLVVVDGQVCRKDAVPRRPRSTSRSSRSTPDR